MPLSGTEMLFSYEVYFTFNEESDMILDTHMDDKLGAEAQNG